MAHVAEQFRRDWRRPQTDEEYRAWEHTKWVFGRQPSSIRCISQTGKHRDACIVKLEWGFQAAFEFICAGGVLVGIPPKRRD